MFILTPITYTFVGISNVNIDILALKEVNVDSFRVACIHSADDWGILDSTSRIITPVEDFDRNLERIQECFYFTLKIFVTFYQVAYSQICRFVVELL